MGWYNANPTELALYRDQDRGQRYVQAFGDEEAVVAKAVTAFQAGDYRFTVDLLNNIISYTADNQNAKLLMADAFEQLGYQEENALYRNGYLSAALELREGGDLPVKIATASEQALAQLPADLFVSFLANLVDPHKAAKADDVSGIFNFGDDGTFRVELSNGVLTYVASPQSTEADFTLQIPKMALMGVLAKKVEMRELVTSGKADLSGDVPALRTFFSVLDSDIPKDMNLVLPLKTRVP